MTKTSDILENLNTKHQEHLGIMRATYSFAAASYFRCHDKEAAKRLENENMREKGKALEEENS